MALLAPLALFGAGCGDDDLQTGDTAEPDTALEVIIPDTGTPEVIVFDTVEPDTQVDTSGDAATDTSEPEVIGPSCSDNPKPFFCPCDTNAQCASSLCIAVQEDDVARRCTQECALNCPMGWECKGVGTGRDQTFICQPPINSLCKPCERAADCQKVGALCITFADGQFCGQDCQNQPTSCPAGYECGEVLNDLGQIDGYQCVRTSGSCNCPDGTDYQNDPANCEFCGNACSFAGAVAGCREGACFLDACTADFQNLNAIESDGCEYRCTFQGDEDWPDGTCSAINDCDQNCDGIDGDYDRGIFVSATGAANAQGTPYDPVRTIAEGLNKATPGARDHLYIAAGTYNESVTLRAGVSIFGGYSNDGKWTRDLALHKTTITSSTGGSSIRVISADGITTRTVVDGIEVLGGTNANPGGSSYAVWVKDSTEALEFVRVTAIGGNGGAGANGSNGAKGNDGEAGSSGTSPQDFECWCEDFNNLIGGPPGNNACTSGGSSAGGRGAHVVENSNCDVARETGNTGQSSPGGATGGQPETQGSEGGGGSPGTDGAGGAANGTVNPSGFWAGFDGITGGTGNNGVGGGGGGSGKTKRSNNVSCGFTNTYWWGGGGGGGGSGGCGGTTGTPGRAGGASFGMFLYNASPKLMGSAFGHRSGGNGGRGGDGGGGGVGKDGGAGGTGYDGAQDGTNGGKGGKGGNGGRGGHAGGGAGGIAFGLYIAGNNSNPTCSDVTFQALNASAGLGGPSTGNKGADGTIGDKNRGTAACP